MSFTKLLALLNDKSLYFARADKLSEMDPFEGRYTQVNAAVLDARWEMESPEFWAEKNFKSEGMLKKYIDANSFSLGPCLEPTVAVHAGVQNADDIDAIIYGLIK